jgi:hypothetical protein
MECEMVEAHMLEVRNVYEISVRKPEGKRQPGSPKSRWKDNIKWVLRK